MNVKNGIDYFSLDVLESDAEIYVQAECGLIAEAVILKILRRIYGIHGYYCEWSDKAELVFAYQNGAEAKTVKEVVTSCLNNGFFNPDLYEKYHILTSKDIQERYAKAAERRKCSKWINEYLLIPVPENAQNVDSLAQNVSNLAQNVDSLKQSKVKESKVKESKVKKSKVKESKGNNYISLSDDKDICCTDVQRVTEAWNELTEVGIKSISRITNDTNRYEMLKARLSEYGIDDVLKAISNVKNSKFLTGRKEKGNPFNCTFDWFIKPNNFVKVLNGNYNDKKGYSVFEMH